jgi:hypothetical protein
MAEIWCGYRVGRAVPGESDRMGAATLDGAAVIRRLSATALDSALDVGRLTTGELLWVSTPDAPPRLFDPPEIVLNRSPAAALLADPAAVPAAPALFESAAVNSLPVSPASPLRFRMSTLGRSVLSKRVGTFLAENPTAGLASSFSRRRIAVGALVALVAVITVVVVSPRGAGNAPTASQLASAVPSTTPEPVGVADPTQASIDFALAAQLPALGPVQGLARSAFTAVITNRSGDFVLVDVYVTKPSGEKTFATVLLQKAGTQWRMREVFDARG